MASAIIAKIRENVEIEREMTSFGEASAVAPQPVHLLKSMGRHSMKETFGQYLSRHRKRLDMKQGELAEKAGISQSYVSGLERGVNKDPDRDYVISIARALGVSVSEALTTAGLSVDTADLESRPDLVYEEVGRTPEGPVYIHYPKGLSADKIRYLKQLSQVILSDDPGARE